MRKIIIDGYEISVEDGKFTKATFTDADGNEVTINLGEDLRLEFVKRRREEFKENAMNKCGTYNFTADPKFQEKMLKGRKRTVRKYGSLSFWIITQFLIPKCLGAFWCATR